MTQTETLRSRLRNLATALVSERHLQARGEGDINSLYSAERRFMVAMADIGAEELLAITGGPTTEKVNTAA